MTTTNEDRIRELEEQLGLNDPAREAETLAVLRAEQEYFDNYFKERMREGLRRAREAKPHGDPQSRERFVTQVLELLKKERQRDPSVSVRARDEKVGELLGISGKTVQRIRLPKKSRGQ